MRCVARQARLGVQTTPEGTRDTVSGRSTVVWGSRFTPWLLVLQAMTRGPRWLLLLAVLLAVLLPLVRTQDEESSQAEAVPAPRPLPRPPSSSAGPTTFAVAEPARQMEQGPLDGRGLRRYRRAAVLTAAAVRDLALTRATVFVCWGSGASPRSPRL